MRIADLAERIVSTNDAFSESDLREVEARLGFEFPPSFRTFLLLSNGGGEVALNDAETLEFKRAKDRFYPHIFCRSGFSGYHDIRPLIMHFSDMGADVSSTPDGIFTIADDLSGNFLTIDCRPESYGQIAVVDHETVGEDFYDVETYSVICDSFDDFVKKCSIRLDRYVVTISGQEPFDILDYGQISVYLDQARKSGRWLRLEHDDEWIEFQPKGNGGFYLRRFYGTPAIWQGYYPPGAKKTSKWAWTKLLKNPKIISFGDIILLFESFFKSRSADVEIRMEQLP